MKTFGVAYKLYSADTVHYISVVANNRESAYDLAVYHIIPKEVGQSPYSAWVNSVTYKNGNYKEFNTFEGKPI